MVLLRATTLILLLFGGGKSDFNSKQSAEVEHFIEHNCYVKCPPETLCINLYDAEILRSFVTQSPDSCKKFCRYAKNCLAFSFVSKTSLCTLYFNLPYRHSLQSDSSTKVELLGDMDCLMSYEKNPSDLCRSLSNIIKLSRTLGGMLIEKLFTGQCLGYGNSSNLKWIDCASATLWRFQRSVMFDTSEEDLAAVKIMPADSPGNCMTTIIGKYTLLPFAYIEECLAENENQQFTLQRGTMPELKGLSPTVDLSDNKCFFKISMTTYEDQGPILTEGSNPLYDRRMNLVNILLPTEYRALCDREQLQTKGVEIEGTAPAFLPGSTISASCNLPGFGFRNFNMATKINFTCWNEQTKVPECERMITAVDVARDWDSDGASEGNGASEDPGASEGLSSMEDGGDPFSVDEIPSLDDKSPDEYPNEDQSGLVFVLVIGNVGQGIFLVIMGIAIVLLLCKVRSIKANQA